MTDAPILELKYEDRARSCQTCGSDLDIIVDADQWRVRCCGGCFSWLDIGIEGVDPAHMRRGSRMAAGVYR